MTVSIIYVMGVSGSGKSTVGKLLAEMLGVDFIDADDFHSPSNRNKMESGLPLTDEDRAGWLQVVQRLAEEQSQKGGAVIACSALKENYRETLSAGIPIPVYWVLLEGSFELIQSRMHQRVGHFMPPSLLQSQFDSLEVPAYAIRMNIENSPPTIAANIIARLA